jgi:SAM-dependent MidA family methyltransferase
VDLRRVPEPPADVPSDPALLDAIRDEIRRDGPMTFARFMEIALYDPARGYYRSPVARPGRAGDFLTAPEAHPIFGRAIARFAASVHAAVGSPAAFTIREFGAGEGALAQPLVETLLRSERPETGGPPPRNVRYLVDEVDERRVAAVADRLGGLGLPPGTVAVAADDGRPIVGLAIANEVLDALPTHRVVQRAGTLREVFVGIADDGRLVDVEGEPSIGVLFDRLIADGIVLTDGQRAEICVEIDRWIARAAAGLERGVLLLIDYGHPADDLYDYSRRALGTLATYRGHRVGDDPYAAIGHQDVTAHVDITAVLRAAEAAGLDHLATANQDTFLARLGIGELLVAEQTRPGATMQTYLEARSALVRMIDPAAMGRFRVLAFGRGVGDGAAIRGLRPEPAMGRAAAPGDEAPAAPGD